MGERTYLCIDLKSFYASVECVARGLNPMTTNLVVADASRTDRTICLAVSPSMKKLGVHNRCRLFEIPKDIPFILALPRMRAYVDCALDIHALYMKHFAPQDMHVYSIDETFFDLTPYRALMHASPREIARGLLNELREELGLYATCGIGSNLYLAKVGMDICAKHSPDFLCELDEADFRARLWDHQPLTDFWRIGPATQAKLNARGIYTQRDIAHADEEWLYRTFGIDAELMVDHAWGREPVTMADIKACQAERKSFSASQILPRDYTKAEARVVVREMMERLCLQLTDRGLRTDGISLLVGYSGEGWGSDAKGSLRVPPTAAMDVLLPAVLTIYDDKVDAQRSIRRLAMGCNHLTEADTPRQLSLLDPPAERSAEQMALQKTMLRIQNRYGKNALLRASDYLSAATARERNQQIGGHARGNDTPQSPPPHACFPAGQAVHGF